MLLGRSALWLLAQIPPGREKVAALTELWHNYLRGRRGHSRTAQTSWCWRADSKCCSCLAEWLSWLERFLMCRSWGCAPQARHVQESARDISTKTTAVGPPPPPSPSFTLPVTAGSRSAWGRQRSPAAEVE